jgi:translation initiation factor RLI1
MHKKLGTFELVCEAGNFSDSEIIVLLGENGTGLYSLLFLHCLIIVGKTTFVNLLAGLVPPDGGVGLFNKII